MWYFADFNILIIKIILNKFQFQPQSVLNLFLFFWAISASVFQAVQNCGNETSVTAALPQNSFMVTRYRYPKRNIVILQPRTGNILKENTWLQFAHNNFVIEWF